MAWKRCGGGEPSRSARGGGGGSGGRDVLGEASLLRLRGAPARHEERLHDSTRRGTPQTTRRTAPRWRGARMGDAHLGGRGGRGRRAAPATFRTCGANVVTSGWRRRGSAAGTRRRCAWRLKLMRPAFVAASSSAARVHGRRSAPPAGVEAARRGAVRARAARGAEAARGDASGSRGEAASSSAPAPARSCPIGGAAAIGGGAAGGLSR